MICAILLPKRRTRTGWRESDLRKLYKLEYKRASGSYKERVGLKGQEVEGIPLNMITKRSNVSGKGGITVSS